MSVAVVRDARRSVLMPAFWLFGSLALGFILLPLAALLATPTLADLRRVAELPDVRAAIALSLEAAGSAALLAGVFGVPLAYLLARQQFPGKGVIEAAVDLPLAIPHTVAGIALLLVFGRRGIIGAPAAALLDLRFWGTFAGIVAAMLFVGLPYAVNAARIGFEAVDAHLERVARTLGAGPWRVFAQVTLPLAWRGVLAGLTLTFARAIGEFAAVMLIAYYPMTGPVKIYEQFLRFGLDDAAATSVLFLAAVLVVFLLLRYFAYGRRSAPRSGR